MISGTVTVTPGQAGTLVFSALASPYQVTVIPVTGTILLAGSAFTGGAQAGCLLLQSEPAPVPLVLDFAEGDALYAGGAEGSVGTFTYIGFAT